MADMANHRPKKQNRVRLGKAPLVRQLQNGHLLQGILDCEVCGSGHAVQYIDLDAFVFVP